MKRHFAVNREEEALDKIILAAQLQPLLSNAKWVKLLTTLVAQWPLVQACQVKLIWEDASNERWLHLELPVQLLHQRHGSDDQWQTAFKLDGLRRD